MHPGGCDNALHEYALTYVTRLGGRKIEKTREDKIDRGTTVFFGDQHFIFMADMYNTLFLGW